MKIKKPDKIYISIFFCRDILVQDLSLATVKAIVSAFPSESWKFTTDDGWWEGKNFEDYSSDDALATIPEERRISMEEYVKKKMVRKEPYGDVKGFGNEDNSLDVSLFYPPEGGARLHKDKKGRPSIYAGDVMISWRPQRVDTEAEQAFIQCMKNLVAPLQASYGFVCHHSQKRRGSALIVRFLSGVYWLTLFGPDYVAMIGKEWIERVQCHKKLWLEDGSVILVLTEHFKDSLTREGRNLKRAAERTIGWKWFWPRFFQRNWYPRLRNLVVDEEARARFSR